MSQMSLKAQDGRPASDYMFHVLFLFSRWSKSHAFSSRVGLLDSTGGVTCSPIT